MTDETTTPDCCLDDGNLQGEPTERDDLVVRVCQVCGRRHYEVVAEPGDMRADAP